MDTLNFNVLSTEEAKALFVKVKDRTDLIGSSLGRYKDSDCKWCGSIYCHGHVGYIEFDFYVMNPVLYKYIPKILSCICLTCNKAIVPRINVSGWADYYKAVTAMGSRDCYCGGKSLNFIFKQKVRKGIFEKEDGDVNITLKDSSKSLYTLGDARNILARLGDHEVTMMGFGKGFRPENLIMDYIPVLPNKVLSNTSMDTDKNKIMQYYKIMLHKCTAIDAMNYYLNIVGLKSECTGQQFIRHILAKKEGLMRGNLMSSRQNRSGRSVITTNPLIRAHEVGVPKDFAKKLTVFKYLTKNNVKEYCDYIYSNDYVSHGNIPKKDLKSMNKRQLLDYLRNLSNQHNKQQYYTERKLKDGDWVIVNRQPTLHRHSILAFNAKLVDDRTIVLNLATVSAFNADFDGDEMTIYVASDRRSIKECKERLAVVNNLISPENGKLIIHPVQDCITGVYTMSITKDTNGKDYSWHRYYDEDTYNRWVRVNGMEEVLPVFYMSCLLPKDFNYKDIVKDGIVVKDCPPINKELFIGMLTKLAKEKPKEALDFMTEIQYLTNEWLKIYPVTVSFFDFCIYTPDEKDSLLHQYYDMYEDKIVEWEHRAIEYPQYAGNIEKRICEVLNGNIFAGIMKSLTIPKDNGLHTIVSSGSKGKKENFVQAWVCLGQQYVHGRQQPMYNVVDIHNPVAKGFVKDCYAYGLSPDSMFMHATAARSTIINTGVNTSDPGYLNRQLSQALSDVIVNKTGLIVNHEGVIIAKSP